MGPAETLRAYLPRAEAASPEPLLTVAKMSDFVDASRREGLGHFSTNARSIT